MHIPNAPFFTQFLLGYVSPPPFFLGGRELGGECSPDILSLVSLHQKLHHAVLFKEISLLNKMYTIKSDDVKWPIIILAYMLPY